VIALVLIGFFGGLLVGYIATGIDIVFFVVLSGFFKVDTIITTVNSILIMGASAYFPALLVLFQVHFQDLRVDLVLMTLVGVLIGARIGPQINMLLGRRKVMLAFGFLLVVEFLRTMMEFFIVSLFIQDDGKWFFKEFEQQ